MTPEEKNRIVPDQYDASYIGNSVCPLCHQSSLVATGSIDPCDFGVGVGEMWISCECPHCGIRGLAGYHHELPPTPSGAFDRLECPECGNEMNSGLSDDFTFLLPKVAGSAIPVEFSAEFRCEKCGHAQEDQLFELICFNVDFSWFDETDNYEYVED